MKNRHLFALPLALILGSCDPPASEVSRQASAEELAAAEAEAAQLEAERERLQAERDAIEAEKEELRQMREAAMAAKEAELQDREIELEAQDEETRLQAEELAARQDEMAALQEDLDRREQALSEQELAEAGTTVIDDWTPSEPAVVQQPVADYDLFYDELDSYGSWFDTPDYGYVYQPTVVVQNRSWRPYTRGRWVCSNLGWTWRSDEPFGWATYHYGRWALLANRGWCWVPGSEWAPSWVAWRQGGGHIGWAPLPPETLAYRRGWGTSVDVDLGIGHNWFNFVEARHMANPLASHCLPVKRNRHFYDQTRGCTNIRYQGFRVIAGGPSYDLIKPLIHDPWPVCILDLDSVGGFGKGRGARRIRDGRRQGNRLQLFAPSLDAPWNPGLRPNRVAERWNEVQVVRAEGGLQPTWSRRFAEVRQRQQQTARQWARSNQERRDAQAAQLQRNREAVATAQTRFRENLARQVNLRRATAKVNQRAGRGSRGNRTSSDQARVQQTQSDKPAVTSRRSNANRLPQGVTRATDDTPVFPGNGRRGTATTANERLAQLRQQQEEARERANQGLAAQQSFRQAAQSGGNRNASNNVTALRERAEQARQQREQESADRAERLARSQGEQRQNLARRQEQNRLAQQQAKQAQAQRLREQQERLQSAQAQARQAQAERVRQQQEKVRLAQEQAKQAQAERARQQQERVRQQQENARRAGEQRARQQQEAAQRAAEQRARQQQELAQRQEANRRAAQERARQQQEAARQAAEERARRQAENQQKLRDAQERMRERVREQQERRKK